MNINCHGRLVDLSLPRVMGILNVTPNSFYDGGRYAHEKDILAQAEKMLHDGADFIDLGAYSSKPSAEFVPEEAELRRLVPAVELLVRHFPDVLLSVDTFRSSVAKAGIEAGAAIVNDISAGCLDAGMLAVVADLRVPYILMHMRGTPQTMVKLTQYDDIVKEMLAYFSGRIAACRAVGISDLILDPGFGFAKTSDQNFEVLAKMRLLQHAGLPVLAGLSRKSTIYRTLGGTPETALNGTTALNMIALSNGAGILRVHDVREAVECVQLHEKLKQATR
jgi:dihydropteroate synthase